MEGRVRPACLAQEEMVTANQRWHLSLMTSSGRGPVRVLGPDSLESRCGFKRMWLMTRGNSSQSAWD